LNWLLTFRNVFQFFVNFALLVQNLAIAVCDPFNSSLRPIFWGVIDFLIEAITPANFFKELSRPALRWIVVCLAEFSDSERVILFASRILTLGAVALRGSFDRHVFYGAQVFGLDSKLHLPCLRDRFCLDSSVGAWLSMLNNGICNRKGCLTDATLVCPSATSNRAASPFAQITLEMRRCQCGKRSGSSPRAWNFSILTPFPRHSF